MDVYDMLAVSLRIHITLNDWKHMTFVSLINVLDSYYPPKEQEAKQTDIDWLLE